MLTDYFAFRRTASRALIAVALGLAFVPHQVFAACSNPAGAEGEIAYNSTYHVMQFCDGSAWISMAAAATYLSETDPKIGTLTALKWCATNAGGTAIDCTNNAPLLTGNNLSDLGSVATARANLGLGTIATQSAAAVTVTGGTINGTAIGGTTPAAGAFTTLSASSTATLSAVTLSSTITGPIGVGIGTSSIAGSSLVDLVSTTKGFLPPRMTTTQRDAISSPATGLTIYNTTTNAMNIYNGTVWGAVGGGNLSGLSDVTITSVANNDILQYSAGTSKWVNTQLTTAVAGVAGPSFSVHKNGTDQTVSTVTMTKVTFGAEEYDTNNNFASDRFTPTVAGKYIIVGQVYCTNNTTGQECIATIYKNGVAHKHSYYSLPGGGNMVSGTVVDVVDMNGNTDYVELYGRTGGTIFGGLAGYTYLQGALLAPLASGTVAGTGSTGHVPIWTSGNAITYDTGVFGYDTTNHALGIGTTAPSTKSVLDMVSTTKGFLPPRMTTTQRDAISGPPTGLTVYNTTATQLQTYNGSAWVNAGAGLGNPLTIRKANTALLTGITLHASTPTYTPAIPDSLPTDTSAIILRVYYAHGGGADHGYLSFNAYQQGASGAAYTAVYDSYHYGDYFNSDNEEIIVPWQPGLSGNVTIQVTNSYNTNVANTYAVYYVGYIAGGGVIGGTASAGTSGQMQFAGASGAFSADSALTWDNTNKALGIGTTAPSTKSVLDLVSTTKGFLPPRMTTTQRDAISLPATGLLIYNTTTNQANIYNGTVWGAVGGGAVSGLSDVTLASLAAGNLLQYNGSAWVNVNVNSAMVTTTMVASWPDAIRCYADGNSHDLTFVLAYRYVGGLVGYRFIQNPAGSEYIIVFNADGSYNSGSSSLSGYATDCGRNLSVLAAAGKTFNFIGTGAVTTFNVGTAAAPGLAVTSDTNTGFYSSGADTVSITAGGIEAARFKTVASGQNYFDFTPSASTNTVTLASAGGGATVPITIDAKGTSAILLGDATGIGTTSVASTALLDIVSTSKGFLPPRMTTTQRDAISSPATELSIYNTTTNQMNIYNGSAWGAVGGGALSSLSDASISSPSSGQYLTWNGSAWVNATGSPGAAGPSFAVHKNSTNQTVSSATVAKLTWSAELFDSNNNFASDRFTPTVAGKYIISASAYCTGTTSYCQVYVYKNGSVYNANWDYGNSTQGQVTSIVDMNGTSDYVEAFVYHASGTVVDGTPSSTYFSGSMLAPLATGVVAGTGSASNVAVWTSGNAITYDTGVFGYDLTNHALGIGTSAPSTKAVLDLVSTTKGFLPPRMTTTNRDAISSPATGLTVYNTTTNALNVYNGSAWAAVGAPSQWTTTGSDVYYSSGGVGIGTTSVNASAALDVVSTAKGFLPPRMTTTQRDAIASPATGLMIYNTTTAAFEFYTGSTWTPVSGGVPTGTIAAFASASCPAGWSEYTAARGRFLRGIDNGAGNDPDGTRAAGGTQADMLASHTHTHPYGQIYAERGSGGVGSLAGGGTYVDRGNLNATGGAETRPKNVAVIFCSYAGTSIASSGITASGTTNYVARWSSSTVIGTGALYDNGTNVGIGTTSPSGTVHVSGNSSSPSLYVQQASTGPYFQIGAAGVMYVSNTGNVGIGTTNPSGRLDVRTSATAITGVSSSTGYGVYAQSAGSHAIYAQTDAVGQMGLRAVAGAGGNSTGVYSTGHLGLYASSDNGYYAYLGHYGAYSLYGNGNIWIGGAYQGSDARLKDNIQPMEKETALERLMKLRPVSFKWKPDSDQARSHNGMQYGLIAQEAVKILPHIVTESETPIALEQDKSKLTLNQKLGKVYGIDYTALVPWLLAAVQDLKELIDGLTAKVEKLVAQVTDHDEAFKKLWAANDNQAAEIKTLQIENDALRKDISELRKAFEASKADNDNDPRPNENLHRTERRARQPGGDLEALETEVRAYKAAHP